VQNHPKFCMFLVSNFYLEEGLKFLELDYKTHPDTDHVTKFHGDWLRELGDLKVNKKHHK